MIAMARSSRLIICKIPKKHASFVLWSIMISLKLMFVTSFDNYAVKMGRMARGIASPCKRKHT
jgi:hypothetical protein